MISVLCGRMTHAVFVVLLTVVMLSGCGVAQPSPADGIRSADSTLNILKREFVRGNTMRFMRFVSKQYEDNLNNRGDLRFDVDRVLGQYSDVNLTFFGLRTTRSGHTHTIRAGWTLRWTCERTGRGCDSAGATVVRRGVTIFEFKREDDQFRLLSQSGDRVFGSHTPGDVRE